MEQNFDLDINNYTADNLLRFFKLDNTFSINQITIDDSNYTSKYKFDIITQSKKKNETKRSYDLYIL